MEETDKEWSLQIHYTRRQIQRDPQKVKNAQLVLYSWVLWFGFEIFGSQFISSHFDVQISVVSQRATECQAI